MKGKQFFIIMTGFLLFVVTAAVAHMAPGNIKSYWRLDEGSGAVAADSISGLDGSITNPNWSTDCMVGACMQSSPRGQTYAQVPDQPGLDLSGDQMTVEAWVYPFGRTYLEGQGNCGYVAFRLGQYGLCVGGWWQNGTMEFMTWTENGYKSLSAPTEVGGQVVYPANSWYHLAGVYNGAEMQLYVNGELKGTLAQSGNLADSAEPFWMGHACVVNGYDQCYYGKIDEVAVYNTALSAAQVEQHYQSGLQGLPYPPLNTAPQVTLAGETTVPEGSSPTYSYTVVDPDGGPFSLVEATCGAGGWLDNSSFDSNTGAGSFRCYFFDGPGSTTVGVTVADNEAATGSDTLQVTVENVAPAASVVEDKTVSQNETFDLYGHWDDPALVRDDPYVWAWDFNADGVFDVSGTASYGDRPAIGTTSFGQAGQYVITFQITDKDGGTDSASAIVTVEAGNNPPDCSAAGPSVDTIWPPDHKFVPVEIVGVTDADGDEVTITINSIYQDEPVDSQGDGSFTPDGQGVGGATAEVRAERSGDKEAPGNGRVYHLSFTADDGQGGSCAGEVLVGVPHDKKDTPVDDGALYDSTVAAP